nr:integrase, catalytic region, zinc finger, CCHC-type, peptidase aspartic, catalytic [Tanacetum cinerariifolium]
MGQDRQMQIVGGNGGNQFRQYAGQIAGNLTGYNDVIRNQIGNGNLVAARAEGNAAGQNGNQISCYNCKGVDHYARNCTAGIQLQEEEYNLMAAAADLDKIEKVNANCILMANLQQALTSGTQTDNALIYDSDESAEVHENCDDNEIFNMFTQEEQYTELLEPIPESHQVPQNDNDVISEVTSVEQGGEIVEQHPANFKETCALYDSLYQNFAIEVEKVNSVNRKLKETNVDLTTELARFKKQTRCFEISQEKYDKLKRCYQQSVYQEQCLSKKINALHLSTDNTKTKRPQPRSNTKHDRVPSASKSSQSKNKEVEVEEHHRNLLLSKNNKHMSSACNNIKLDSQDVISNVVCARKPRFLLRWSPTGRLFDQKGNIVNFSESESQYDYSNGDNACTSNTLEPKIKRFTNSTSLLGRLSRFVCGDRSTNLYTINLHEMDSTSPICLMARASSTTSWLWHQRLSHLNFDTINDLARNDLVSGLPKFKYHKEHLCPSCEQGKSKRASHPPKLVPNSRQRLHLLHMDLCGPMRIASINGKRVVERRNRTLVEAARTMLIFSRAPLFLWAEAIATACFTQNRFIIHRRFNKTPYELINGRKLDISFLHVFGALCYPKNDREDIGKLGA